MQDRDSHSPLDTYQEPHVKQQTHVERGPRAEQQPHGERPGPLSFGLFGMFGLFSLSGLILAAATPAETASAPGEAASVEASAPPPVRVWTTRQDAFVFTAEFKPGIPKPGQLTEILFSASTLPKTAHPRFGTQVPMMDAHLTLRFESPKGTDLGRYLAHPLPLTKGRYGVHFTPTEPGIYRLTLEGKTSEGASVAAKFALAVDVWPLPEELQGEGDRAHAQISRRVFTAPTGQRKPTTSQTGPRTAQ